MAQAGEGALNWQELVPSWPARAEWWNPERLRMLDEYMRRAEASRRRGHWEAAVGHWEEALRRLPDMPEPRRRQLVQHIQDALQAAARAAMDRAEPDWRAARRHLERAARVAGDAGGCWLLGLVAHLAGEPAAALRWYERAAAARGAGAEVPGPLAYGRRLARLQLAGPMGKAAGAAAGRPARKGGATAPPAGVPLPALGPDPASLLEPGREGPAGRGHPLAAAAWRRLAALSALAHGDGAEALARFPRPGDPGLPGAWALEGALLAAMAGDWSRCLAYYRCAQAQGAALTGEPHPYVFAAAWLRTDDGRGDRVPFPLAVLRERAPRHLFVDEAQYRALRRQFLRWQCRWWLARARAALERRDDQALRSSLTAAARLLPRARSARLLEAWLACAYGAAKPPKLVGHGLPVPETPAARRLAVWVAERFGSPADAIGQLNRLLEEEPQDPWGLDRWKRWMLRLGQEALARGRWRQALLQFVSLLLRLPDDPDGWRWCGRVLEELGEAARAGDCLAQAQRLAGPARRGRAPGPAAAGGEASGEAEIEYGLLAALLDEAGREHAREAAPGAFSARALIRAVWASVRAGDAYLEFLVKEWVRRPGSAASPG
ncbi:MAG TPA: hypothetical protein VKZ69_04170 [Limnochordales bacterium]|nr:hypothetical protein [Limnochordales bacterium]